MKPVEELSGSELDAAVATEVMGLVVGKDQMLGLLTAKVDEAEATVGWLPNYSASIEAAWEVVERAGRYAICENDHGGAYAEIYIGETEGCAGGDTAPEAICKAALTAVRSTLASPVE